MFHIGTDLVESKLNQSYGQIKANHHFEFIAIWLIRIGKLEFEHRWSP